ncbi:hypothetical protein G5716_29825 [Bacillus pacificus]|nr:hypothetical protein [Bacillus pacificus]
MYIAEGFCFIVEELNPLTWKEQHLEIPSSTFENSAIQIDFSAMMIFRSNKN